MAKKLNLIESVANASDSLRAAKDSIYVSANKIQKKANEAQEEFKKAKRGQRIDEDMERENAKSREKALAKLQKTNQADLDQASGEIRIDGELIEVGGPIQIDKSRANFDQVGEYNDTKMKENIKIGDIIFDWIKYGGEVVGQDLTDEDDEYQKFIAKKNGTDLKHQSNTLNKADMKRRVDMAKQLYDSFETSGSFDEKIELYNKTSGLSVSESNLIRTQNLDYIFKAFCGDTASKDLVNEIKNNEHETRMVNTIKQCLDGDITEERMNNCLFAEIHGMDSKKLPENNLTNEMLIELCTMQELSPQTDMNDFVNSSAAQLKTIKDAAVSGNINSNEVIETMAIQENVNKVLRTGESLQTELKINGRSDGFLGFDINIDNDNVDISHFKPDERELTFLGSANENGMVVGQLDDILKVYQTHTIGDIVGNSLDREISINRDITTKEARDHAMTPEEKEAWKREEEAAVAEATANYKRNFASGV